MHVKTGAYRWFWVVMAAVLLAPTCALPARAQEPAATRQITVTGDAEVRVAPDEVLLTLGVETSDKDLGTAKRQNDERVKKVLALATESGIDPKDVQTEYINIEPRYRYSDDQNVFIGYFVRKTILVTLKDISRFEDLLSTALESGVNYVHGVEFRTTELRKYRDQARALAIQAAKEKAAALAEALGQKASVPQDIREDHSGWSSSYNSWWGNRWGGTQAQNVIQNAGPSGSIEGSVAPGQISVQASVTVVFKLE
jgi:uncharacterized protein